MNRTWSKAECVYLFGIEERTKKELERGLEVEETSKGVHVKMEAQSKSTSSPFRSSGVVCTKTVAQIAYGLGFGRSSYG
ncbi:hypothetical protein EJB05_49646, partial [Eragrostis curvula]